MSITINRQTGLPAENAAFWASSTGKTDRQLDSRQLESNPRLTVNLGLRWKTWGSLTPQANRGSHFVFGTGDTPTGITRAEEVKRPNLYRPDRNDVAPRVGFALTLAE